MRKQFVLGGILSCLFIMSVTANGLGDEPQHRGKPLSHWVAQLRHENPSVRANAATALGRIGPNAKSAVPELERALLDLSFGVRYQAAWALGQIGPDATAAVPSLMQLVTREDAIFRSAGDVVVRGAAIKSLGEIGPQAKAAVPVLVAVLERRETDQEMLLIRSEAARAIGRIGPEARDAIPALIAVLQDRKGSRERLREAAAVALGKTHASTAEGLQALSQALEEEPSPQVRLRAAEALGEMGPLAQAAAPALQKALNDRDPRVRAAASKSLERVESKSESKIATN